MSISGQSGVSSPSRFGGPTSVPVTILQGGTGSADTGYGETLTGVVNASLGSDTTNRPSWLTGSDVGAWINAAITHLGTAGGTVTLNPGGGPYAMTTRVTIPLNVVIDGQGAEVRWAATSGTPFVMASTSWSPSTSSTMWALRNIKINHVAGTGDGNTCIALYIGGDPSNTLSASTSYGMMAKTHNVDIRGFNTAIQFGNNTWSMTLDVLRLHNNVNAFYVPSGLTNAGELIKSTNSVIHDNTSGYNSDNYNYLLAFLTTSFDYNTNAMSGSHVVTSLNCVWLEQSSGPHVSSTGTAHITGQNVTVGLIGGTGGNGYFSLLGNDKNFNEITLSDVTVFGTVFPSYIVYTNASAGIITSFRNIQYNNSSNLVPHTDETGNYPNAASAGHSRLTTDFAKTSDVALANIGVFARCRAGKSYAFKFRSQITCAGAGGVKFDLGGGGLTITNLEAVAKLYDNGGVTIASLSTLTTALDVATTSTTVLLEVEGTIEVNAEGSFRPRGAQHASNVTATTFLRGARFEVEELR